MYVVFLIWILWFLGHAELENVVKDALIRKVAETLLSVLKTLVWNGEVVYSYDTRKRTMLGSLTMSGTVQVAHC